MNHTTASPDTVRTLAHADVLLLIADLLGHPAADLTWPQAATLLDAAGWSDPGHACVIAWRRLVDALRDTPAEDRCVEHHRLFEGATACPPNQTAYVRRDKGAILGDLCGFYRAFSLTSQSGDGEKPDHVVTQLQFLALLLVMGADAGPQRSDEQRQIAIDAAQAFADEHLSPWLSDFGAHLDRTTALPLYRAMAEVIAQTWSTLADAHGWTLPAPDGDGQPVVDIDPPSDECADLNAPIVPLHIHGTTSPAPNAPRPAPSEP